MEKNSKHGFWSFLRHSGQLLLAAIIIAASTFIYSARSAPPGSRYNLGETLAPTCAPGSPNCSVVTPAASGANSDITSMNALTSVGIGDPSPASPLTVRDVGTNAADGEYYATVSEHTIDPSSNQTANAYNAAIDASATVDPSNTDAVGNIRGINAYGLNGGSGGVLGFMSGITSSAINTGGTGTISEISGIRSLASTDNGTVSSMMGLSADTSVNGGSIDTENGIFVGSMDINAGTVNNRRGIFIATPNGTPITSDYGVYQEGPDQKNYFAGNVGIGSFNPGRALVVSHTTTEATPGVYNATQDVFENIFPGSNQSGDIENTSLTTNTNVDPANTNAVMGVNGFTAIASNAGTGSVRNINGINANASNSGNATVTSMTGLVSTGVATAGTVGGYDGIYSGPSVDGAAVGTMNGLEIGGMAISSGTVTDRFALSIDTPAGTPTGLDYGIYQQGPSQKNWLAGNTAIGTNTDPGNAALNITHTNTLFADDSYDAQYVEQKVLPAGNQTANASNRSIETNTFIDAANTNDVGSIFASANNAENDGTGDVLGIIFGSFNAAENIGNANVTGMFSTWSGGEVDDGNVGFSTGIYLDPSVGGGVVTNLYGVQTGAMTISGGTVGSRFGVYIGAPAGTPTSGDWGVYQVASTQKNYFGGRVGIGNDNPSTSAALDISSTTGALIIPRMTTTDRDNLTAVNGMIIYNTTTDKFQGYENGTWVNFI